MKHVAPVLLAWATLITVVLIALAAVWVQT